MKLGILIPSVTTHKGAILARLLHGEKLRNKRLFHDIDSCASGARISELRSDGWKIDDKFVHAVTKEKKEVQVKEYFISRSNLIEYLKNQNLQDFLALAERKYKKAS